MKLTIACSALVLALMAPLSHAIAPESGMYWNPAYSGRGFYIEHQNGRVGVSIYAFDQETGEAAIYNSGGLLRDDGPFWVTHPEPPLPEEGQFPVHGFVGDLYRTSFGQPLVRPLFPGRPAQAEKVGQIFLTFLDTGSVTFVIQLDDGGFDTGSVERFAFGHGRHSSQYGSRFTFDLRGEWLFVDMSDPEAAPLRFHFSQRLPEDAPYQIGPGETFDLSYVDPGRDARLVCATFPAGDSGSTNNPQKRSGCELFVGEELILSANRADVGLDRIQAYRGSLPAPGANPYRRPETMIGLRVVMPPPSDEPEDPGED
jgi:hypothetical protein